LTVFKKIYTGIYHVKGDGRYGIHSKDF
jgi:hypothetical protein